MIRPAAILLLALPLAAALAQEPGEGYAEDAESSDLAGVWHSISTDVVIRRSGDVNWLGYLSEGGGVEAGRVWHFHQLPDGGLKFWITLEGGAAIQKVEEQKIERGEDPDELTVRVGEEALVFRRIFAPIPARIGEVKVSCGSAARSKPSPDQDVDVRLVRALERAVEAARAADPDLKRVNVSTTINRSRCPSKRHSRYHRLALDIDLVNGAGADHWREDVEGKLASLEKGEQPDIDLRRDFARHAAALALAFTIEPEISEVVCPPILDEDCRPYLEWWLRRYRKGFPDRYPSEVGFLKKIDEMLDATKGARRQVKEWLHVSVRPLEKAVCSHRKAREKKFDRE